MITTLLALAVFQEAAPDNVYERLKKQNLFSPKLEKPPPPKVERKEEPKEVKKEEPPPPRMFPFEIAGIVYNTTTQAYEVLVLDREWDDGSFLKPGDAIFGAKVEAIAADRVTVAVNGETKEYRVGESWKMLVEGRKGGKVSEEKREERKEEKKEEVAEAKPASGDRPKREVSGGLLERWRKMKKENP